MSSSLIEIFSSIQGEGLYLGVRQIFIRFAGCNLKCAYCDTPYIPSVQFRVEMKSGSGDFQSHANPAAPEGVAEIIRQMRPELSHSVSLTGGEPLLHADFIMELATLLKEHNLKIYLETNGTLSRELERVLKVIDIISMDIKLPGSTDCGDLWDIHEDFLRIGQEKEIFLKTVVTSETSKREIIRTCETIQKVNRDIPLIIQPVDSHEKFPGRTPSISQLIDIQEMCSQYLSDVRIIPQTHKFMGIL